MAASRRLHFFLISAFFLVPYVLIWFLAPSLEMNNWQVGLTPFFKSLYQATWSAMGSVVFGLLLSVSLFACDSKKSLNQVRVLLLAPNLLPPIYVILSLMSFTKFFGLSYQGFFWVVLLHILINSGLFAVAFHSYFFRIYPHVEVARVLGSSTFNLWRKVILPLGVPLFIQNFFLIFGICLVSFSIPFVLSGGEITSLEVYIFRLMRSEGQWGLALFYSTLQATAVLFLVLVLQSLKFPFIKSWQSYRVFKKPRLWMRYLSLFPFSVLIFFWMTDLFFILIEPSSYQISGSTLGSLYFLESLFNSLILFVLIFLIQLILCIFVTWGDYSSSLENFFRGYMAPSLVILGFALSLLPGESEFILLLKTALCFSLLTFPLVFRWQILDHWKSLNSQVQTAFVLGGRRGEVFWNITWPQLKWFFVPSAMLVSVWSLGDFAVSSFFLQPDQTLGLLILDGMSRYQLNMANLLSSGLFLFGLVVIYFTYGVLDRVRD